MPSKIIYGRRAFDRITGEPITFTSWDKADNNPSGWTKGWFQDGDEYRGHVLQHVYEPSWRCVEPQRLNRSEAA